jgi:outer membrane protein assembly factor BamA
VLYFNQKRLGSDFNFIRFSVDAAQYFKVGKNGVFAANAFTELVFGDPPFQQLAFIGGSKKLCGFFEGRYRDKKLWLLQAEYRQWIWKFIGGTVFVGAGSVAPELKDFTDRKVHLAFGAGLRVRLSKKDKINLRIDAGFDEHFNLLPYVTVGEAF